MQIRVMQPSDLNAVMQLWNSSVQKGEVLYFPMTEEYFQKKFVLNEGCEPENLLVAETEEGVAGFLHGVAPEAFRLGKPGNAYLTCLMVQNGQRGKGVGKALLDAWKSRMKARGAQTLFISSVNPVNLDWHIPGTPGHDHNNVPGLDTGCAGYGFFLHEGFETRYREVSLYIDLSTFRLNPQIAQIRKRLQAEGISTGPYDPDWNCGFDRLCDRVGSEYWRDVLRTEIDAWKHQTPNQDARMWADGVPPRGPRTLLTAVHDGQIVGFTGPIDLQKSGRGWFTGICTDPEYEHRGIATVLFNLLMQAFVEEGAAFSTLFTGLESHARKVYERAGLRPVREFALMSMPL